MRKAKLKFMNTVWEKKGNSDIQAVRLRRVKRKPLARADLCWIGVSQSNL